MIQPKSTNTKKWVSVTATRRGGHSRVARRRLFASTNTRQSRNETMWIDAINLSDDYDSDSDPDPDPDEWACALSTLNKIIIDQGQRYVS